jgi:hypothetical protein
MTGEYYQGSDFNIINKMGDEIFTIPTGKCAY